MILTKERPTRKAPHMEKYVVIHDENHWDTMSLQIGNQSFPFKIMGEAPHKKPSKKELLWYMDMLCIALAELVRLENGKGD